MSNKRKRANDPAAQADGQEIAAHIPIAVARLFARQLRWRLELYLDDNFVVIQLIHTSHMRGSAVLGGAQGQLVEQFTKTEPSGSLILRRSLFRDEEHIRAWFASICEAFDENLHGTLTFEILHHFQDLAQFQLDLDGILKFDKNEIINNHIEGDPTGTRDIGTREYLRILLGARGPSNESPANEFNLPNLIKVALRNLNPSRLLTYEGVNDYLKVHHPDYSAASGDSFRKRCTACKIDFMALVREERERRKAEN